MPFSIDDLQDEVRGRLGDPSEAELPSDQIERSINASMREFSRFKKRKASTIIPLIAGQTDYTIPAGTVEVSDALLVPSLFFETMTYPVEYYFSINGDDFRILMERARIRLIDNFIVDLDVIPSSPPVLRISPVPEIDAFMHCRLHTVIPFEQLDDTMQEVLIMFIEGDCMEYIGRKRSKSVRQVPTAAGNLKLDDGLAFRKEGCELKKKFRSIMGQGATMLDAG